MTDIKLKFFKVATLPTSGLEVGGIYFNKTTGFIHVATSPTTVDTFGSKLSDAQWNAETSTLSLTKSDGSALNLDFSDMASNTVVSNIITAVGLNTTGEFKSNAANYGGSSLGEEIKNIDAAIGSLSDLSVTPDPNLTIVSAINEVKGSSEISIIETNSEDYVKSYEIKQGSTTVGTINIPKDLVVKSGTIVKDPAGQNPGTYIELIIQNQDTPLYINVADLVDIYTSEQNPTQIDISISNHVISATIVAGSITSTELGTDSVITEKIKNKAVTKEKLATTIQTTLDKVDTMYTNEQIDSFLSWVEFD